MLVGKLIVKGVNYFFNIPNLSSDKWACQLKKQFPI